MRAAVCSSPECAHRFDEFVTSLDAREEIDLDQLCTLDERQGTRAMAKLLATLAVRIEEYMGLSSKAAAVAALRLEAAASARAPRGGGGSTALGAAVVVVGVVVLAIASTSRRGERAAPMQLRNGAERQPVSAADGRCEGA